MFAIRKKSSSNMILFNISFENFSLVFKNLFFLDFDFIWWNYRNHWQYYLNKQLIHHNHSIYFCASISAWLKQSKWFNKIINTTSVCRLLNYRYERTREETLIKIAFRIIQSQISTIYLFLYWFNLGPFE